MPCNKIKLVERIACPGGLNEMFTVLAELHPWHVLDWGTVLCYVLMDRQHFVIATVAMPDMLKSVPAVLMYVITLLSSCL